MVTTQCGLVPRVSRKVSLCKGLKKTLPSTDLRPIDISPAPGVLGSPGKLFISLKINIFDIGAVGNVDYNIQRKIKKSTQIPAFGPAIRSQGPPSMVSLWAQALVLFSLPLASKFRRLLVATSAC